MLHRVSAVRRTLPNGLRVVTVGVPHLHGATIVVYAKVGSRYETPKDNGLSHFLEHMLFRGTAGHPSSFELNLAIEELGGTLYAETGRDYSLYQISLDPELVPEGLALFGEIFGAPAFTQLELERRIILEELNEDFDERGRDVNIDDLARRTAFPGHPLGQKITGPRENVKRFALADVKRHFARFYGAKNLILCVAGKVDPKTVFASAKRHLSRLPSGSAAITRPPRAMTDGPHFAYVDNPGAQTAVQVLYRALPESHPDYVALQALSRVLDDGMSTRLHYRLADQRGLAYYVSGGLEPFHDTAQLEIDAASSHANFTKLLEGIFEILGEFRDAPVTDRELAKAKRRYRLDLASAFDDVEALAGWFGGTELFYAAPDYAEKVAKMDAVTPADIRRAAQLVLTPERLVVAGCGGLTANQRKDARAIVMAHGRPAASRRAARVRSARPAGTRRAAARR